MKLNEYLYDRLLKAGCIFGAHHLEVKEEDIDYWIVEWYKEKFGKIPPQWLVNRDNVVII